MIYKKSWKYILVKSKSFKNYYRPKALKDFSNIRKDDIGGHLEGYHNLSQTGDCWIYGSARVSENVIVKNDAQIFGNAIVFGSAVVNKNAKVYGNTMVFGSARITDNAQVCGNACVNKDILISGNTKLVN